MLTETFTYFFDNPMIWFFMLAAVFNFYWFCEICKCHTSQKICFEFLFNRIYVAYAII